MTIRIVRQASTTVASQWLVVGVFEKNGELAPELRGTPAEALCGRLIAQKELNGSLGELTALHGLAGFEVPSVLLVGLGTRNKFDALAAYTAGVALAKRLAGKPRDSVAVSLASLLDGGHSKLASALIEGVIVGQRSAGLRKSEPNRHTFGRLDVVLPAETTDEAAAAVEALVARAEIVGQAVNLARDLVNTPPSEKPPGVLAAWVGKHAADAGIDVQIWDEAKIREERFGGLLAVAAGSDEPPAFVVLEYRKGGEAPTLALVGKGVTFDSGGLSLKPSASMEDMKSDMTGAAVVAATMQAIARLGLAVNVVGYLAITENMTGGRAMKLGDVLTMRNGKTVEVLNTDAEGRLILADALSYAAESRPARILDLATLTGACMVGLGPKIAGLFSNDEVFTHELLESCGRTGERAWEMPFDDDFKDQLKSNVADLKNVGGKWGGAITAAKFLEEFTASIPWIHLDIAGPSWNDGDSSTRDVGGTGCFVRTLTTHLESIASTRVS
ncbi:leucyl aminopeptidase [Paludisphaera borealis]|uniref:Probable cytosol aminopeptidase n=1 Tax=Paludisphaera borealis TaxID=1387353 RepID=A0A1U7CKH0_9BACT|nr:leucyl aminopeptidase [Paludisphaera borealis]APW59429.1 Cytosol aminopeptidase [Paludisphaera borealis]